MTQSIPPFFVNAFYHARFADNLFVVKASGDVIEDDAALTSLIADIKVLISQGIRILFVYGAGGTTDTALQAQGLPVNKHEGRRITDAATLDVMKAELGGRLSLKLHAAIAQANIEGLVFNAVPHGWLDVALRPKKPLDFGFVGNIIATHKAGILQAFRAAPFVACACLASCGDGTLVNINADTVATELAIATHADKLILLSNVEGVLVEGKRAFLITAEEIPALIANKTVIGGMRVKMENCGKALASGVKRIHIINGLRPHALHQEIFESVGPGTMIMRAAERDNYLREVEIHKQIKGDQDNATY